jgi:hypothetical protein
MNSNKNSCARRAIVWPVAGVAGAFVFAGCSHRPIIVQTPAPTVIQAPASAAAPVAATTPPPLIVVNQPPPAPLQETQSPQPSPQDVWIPGYWAWRNNQQQWIPGHWEVPPHPGATWIPARWEQRGSEYVFVDGYWQ